MTKLTRRDFILMGSSSFVGIIGTISIMNRINESRINNTPEYITQLPIDKNEFITLKYQDRLYVALGGSGILPGEEVDFVDELISKNITQYDNCDIHCLPKKEGGPQELYLEAYDGPIFLDTTITTDDDLNYTITSKSKDIINNIQKHSSDILAKNNELFNQTKTR